jgi:hypothetical protein
VDIDRSSTSAQPKRETSRHTNVVCSKVALCKIYERAKTIPNTHTLFSKKNKKRLFQFTATQFSPFCYQTSNDTQSPLRRIYSSGIAATTSSSNARYHQLLQDSCSQRRKAIIPISSSMRSILAKATGKGRETDVTLNFKKQMGEQ